MASVMPDLFSATERHRTLIGTKLYCLMTGGKRVRTTCCYVDTTQLAVDPVIDLLTPNALRHQVWLAVRTHMI